MERLVSEIMFSRSRLHEVTVSGNAIATRFSARTAANLKYAFWVRHYYLVFVVLLVISDLLSSIHCIISYLLFVLYCLWFMVYGLWFIVEGWR